MKQDDPEALPFGERLKIKYGQLTLWQRAGIPAALLFILIAPFAFAPKETTEEKVNREVRERMQEILERDAMDSKVQKEMQKVYNQVVADAERQYEIAKKNGTATDAYVAAGLVKAAYLQANDEENYKKWTRIEKQEGKRIGL